MAKGYSLQTLGVLAPSPINGAILMADGGFVDARPRSTVVVLTGASLVAQGVGAVGDTIVVAEVPAFALFRDLNFQTDTTLSGCTLQFGVAGNLTKYGSLAAAAANTPLTLRPVAVSLAQYAVPETIIITVTGAALPAAFNATVNVSYQVSG